MSTPTVSSAQLDELRFRLDGDLHAPGDPAYEDACTLFNAMVQTRPRLVARCATPDEVVAAVAFARDAALPLAVRAGGHSVTGRSLCEDGLVLDVRPMDAVEVDAGRRVARVGGGATWAHVDRAAHRHGLATTGGRVSTTGVVGLTAGGGSGWLERAHGLACDNLLAVELVTAEGELVRADEHTNPELLWALRGGGAGFGVVTAVELRLHPLPAEVLAGLAIYPGDRAREAMRLFRDTMRDAPEGLGLAFDLTTAPDDDPDVPDALRGRPVAIIVGMYAGSVADGERALAPIRASRPAADLFGPTSYPDFQCSIDDPPGHRNWWTAEQTLDLPDDAIDALCDWAQGLPPGPSQLFVVPWGGAVARATERTSPLVGRDSAFVVHPLLMWDDPADDDATIAFGHAFRDAIGPWATGSAYLNFVSDVGRARVRAAYSPSAMERLAAIKAAWDPEGAFPGSHRLA